MASLDSLLGLGFPEALRWRDGALWFSDMFRSRVMRWIPGQEADVILDRAGGGPVMPGGLGWLPCGDLLVVDCTERRVLRVHDGTVSVHADLADLLSHSANDMHVDSDGTAWVGSYGFDPEHDQPVGSALVRIAPSGEPSLTQETFVFPNGIERDRRGSLLVAETFADRVSAVSAGEGVTVHEQCAVGSGPDGISIGPDGVLYVALAFAGQLVAVDHGPARETPPRVLYTPTPIADGPGAGPLGVYDCAAHPSGRLIAVALASADEAVAERIDTGRIVLLPLPMGRV